MSNDMCMDKRGVYVIIILGSLFLLSVGLLFGYSWGLSDNESKILFVPMNNYVPETDNETYKLFIKDDFCFCRELGYDSVSVYDNETSRCHKDQPTVDELKREIMSNVNTKNMYNSCLNKCNNNDYECLKVCNEVII